MTFLRTLAWLIALVGFIVPSLGTASMAHAAHPVEQAAAAGCPDHAPPPDSCPAKGTAKHAAGDCCPVMACSLAVLPPTAGIDGTRSFRAPGPGRVPSLAGRTFTQDPPPPRV